MNSSSNDSQNLLPSNVVFVFGSNELGIHGAGAAKFARANYGALNGCGEGLQGQSYAIPTKASPYVSLPLQQIKTYVERFLTFAKLNNHLTFLVTPIGCGLAGYQHNDIAPFFKDATTNVSLPPEWKEIIYALHTSD